MHLLLATVGDGTLTSGRLTGGSAMKPADEAIAGAQTIQAPPSEAGAASPTLQPGQELLHYRLVERLGAGGNGEVYRAEDLRLGRSVAIKVLLADSGDPHDGERLLREARAASAIRHPNVVTIHAIETAPSGTSFIVMEHVDGEPFSALLKRGPLDPGTLVDLGAQIAEGLAAAHAAGLVHRDVKPENVLLTRDGRVKVVDFGIAKDTGVRDTSLLATRAGTLVGTPYYMSPEQARGEPVDARGDLFALGVLLYEAATEKHPFAGPTLLATLHAIAHVEPELPSALRSELPAELDAILMRALAKDPAARFQRATEMAAALRALSGAAGEDTRVAAPPPETRRATTVVGRERESATLAGQLADALAGSTRIVFVTGEPGLGKSTLVEAFLDHTRAYHPSVMVGCSRCTEHLSAGEAYLPFLEAVSALVSGSSSPRVVEALRAHAPTWCVQLPASLGTTSREALERDAIGATPARMIRELGDALAALAATRPILLVLEDLHWADAPSLDLLRHLAARLVQDRIMLLGTFRAADLGPKSPLRALAADLGARGRCQEIALEPLGVESVARYLDARFPNHELPASLAERLHRRTEGHPLFTASAVDFLVERGDLAEGERGFGLTRPVEELAIVLPESVTDLIRAKLDALPEEDRRLLEYASVQGDEILSTVTAKALGQDDLEVDERLARLAEGRRFLVRLAEEELPDGELATRYRFAHVLLQHALYERLVPKRRVALHLSAGETLLAHHAGRDAPIAAQLALHFERGRAFGRAIHYCALAGDNALRLVATTEAIAHYDRGLALVERLPTEERPAAAAALHRVRAGAYSRQGRFRHAAEDLDRVVTYARTIGAEGSTLEGTALVRLAGVHFLSNRVPEMSAAAEHALAVAERASNEAVRLDARLHLGLRDLLIERVDECAATLDEVLACARAGEHTHAAMAAAFWRGIIHHFRTEYEPALALATEARDLALGRRDAFSTVGGDWIIGLALGNLGRMSSALAALSRALDRCRRNGDIFFEARILNSIGWIHRELGDHARALELDRLSVEAGRRSKNLEAEANSLINVALGETEAGRSDAARAACAAVEAIFQREDWMRWRYALRLYVARAEGALAAGDLQLATRGAASLLEQAGRHKAAKYVALARLLLARAALAAGDLARAAQEGAHALEALSDRPAVLVSWRVQALLGDVSSRLGDDGAARAAFARAAAQIRAIADGVEDETLRATFLAAASVREALDRA